MNNLIIQNTKTNAQIRRHIKSLSLNLTNKQLKQLVLKYRYFMRKQVEPKIIFHDDTPGMTLFPVILLKGTAIKNQRYCGIINVAL